MIDLSDIRRLARALPEVEVPDDDQAYPALGGKGLCWAYLARETPKGRRVAVPGVVAVRCAIETKEMLLETAPDRFFTDDHYRTYPAVLVRLDRIDEAEMAGLLRGAWRVTAPKAVARRHPDV